MRYDYIRAEFEYVGIGITGALTLLQEDTSTTLNLNNEEEFLERIKKAINTICRKKSAGGMKILLANYGTLREDTAFRIEIPVEGTTLLNVYNGETRFGCTKREAFKYLKECVHKLFAEA